MENIDLTGMTQATLDVFTTLSRFSLAGEHLDLHSLNATSKRLNPGIDFEGVAKAIKHLQGRGLVELFTSPKLKDESNGHRHDAYRPTEAGFKLHRVINDVSGHKALLHLREDALALVSAYDMSHAKPAIPVNEQNLMAWPWQGRPDGVRFLDKGGADFVLTRLIELEELELVSPDGEVWNITPNGVRMLNSAGMHYGTTPTEETVWVVSKLLFGRLRSTHLTGITLEELTSAIQDMTQASQPASGNEWTTKTLAVFRAACMVSRAGNMPTLQKLVDNCHGFPISWDSATADSVAAEVVTLTRLGVLKADQMESEDKKTVTLFSRVTDKGWNFYMKMQEPTTFIPEDLKPIWSGVEFEHALAGVRKYASGDGTAPFTGDLRVMLAGVTMNASGYEYEQARLMLNALEDLQWRLKGMVFINPESSLSDAITAAAREVRQRLENLPRTPEEIQALKESWMADGCWDIEDSEGFEAHREELLAFRLDYTARHKKQARERAEAGAAEIASKHGITLEHAHMVYDVRQRRPYALEEAENSARHLFGNAGLEPYLDWGADIGAFVERLGDYCASVAEERVLLLLGKVPASSQPEQTKEQPDG